MASYTEDMLGTSLQSNAQIKLLQINLKKQIKERTGGYNKRRGKQHDKSKTEMESQKQLSTRWHSPNFNSVAHCAASASNCQSSWQAHFPASGALYHSEYN